MIEQVGDRIVLVGTAHVSPRSIEDVRQAIADHDPDVVAVELDERRREVLEDRERWKETPITEMIRGNRAAFFIAHILLSSYQRRLGEEFGAEPGSEMLAAIEEAEDRGIDVALVDREIGVTMKRAWARMGFREKLRLTWEFLKAMTGAEEVEEVDIEELMEEDVLTQMMEELAEMAPSISDVLIKERDAYLARKIHDAAADGRKVVAVVGAGHVAGIKQHLARDVAAIDLEALEHVPEKRVSWAKVVGYGVVAAVLAAFGFLAYRGFVTGDYSSFIQGLQYWILLNGVFSAIGAAIARGHILSILTAFAAAPITSLNPTVAAGWFAGLVELKVRTPNVGDFEALSRVESFGDWVDNSVTRVLLVTALANVGSMIGTYLGAAYLVDLLSKAVGIGPL